jgi:hypothetical protein
MTEQPSAPVSRPVPDDRDQAGRQPLPVEGDQISRPGLLDKGGDLVEVADGEMRGNVHAFRLGGLRAG